jgi:hypothetical protein
MEPKSPKGSVGATDDKIEHKPNKRSRLTQEDTATLSVTTKSNSLKGSGKASNNEPKGRRRQTKRRVTSRQLGDHINTEFMWWDTTAGRCATLRKLLAEQNKRLRLSKELGDLEERRSEVTAGLRKAAKSANCEGAAMEQDLEQWSVEEKKVTDRIEKSR